MELEHAFFLCVLAKFNSNLKRQVNRVFVSSFSMPQLHPPTTATTTTSISSGADSRSGGEWVRPGRLLGVGVAPVLGVGADQSDLQ
jgi:hypothetical protein